MQIPAIGLGTYRLQGQVVIDSIHHALSLGYRAIDTAQIYENEADVGKAIMTSGVPRPKIFITTKVWVTQLSRQRLITSLKLSLEKLQTDYIDLALIHWPSPNGEVLLEESLQALQEAQNTGLIRQFGISNFTIELVQQAIDIVGADLIATNQVEISPFLQNKKLVNFAKDKNIHLTSYMTLAYGKVLKNPVICEIAKNYGATPAQVALAWALKLGCAVIPSSTKSENLASNLLAQNIELKPEDMEKIAALDSNQRLANPANLAPKWD